MDKSIFETNEIHKLAKKNFAKFVTLIKNLLIKDQIKFDLIVGSGNSGMAMLKFLELIYLELSIPLPMMIKIPIYRFKKDDVLWSENNKDLFDNRILLPKVKKSW